MHPSPPTPLPCVQGRGASETASWHFPDPHALPRLSSRFLAGVLRLHRAGGADSITRCMRLRVGQIGCVLLLALFGCKSEGLPADPLFANRKPPETKAKAADPVDTPLFEPTPPVQRSFVARR